MPDTPVPLDRLVMERFGNTECRRDISLRVCDIYDVGTGGGRIFFVVEASLETIEAFLDDAFHAPGSPLPAGVMVVPFYNK